MEPSIGRIVHYVSHGTPGGEYTQECRAAIVTGIVEDAANMGCVSLAVLSPAGMLFDPHVAHNETTEQRGGTWHWPERIDG